MRKIVLVFRIVLTEWKIKFYEQICCICEKVESFLVKNEKNGGQK